MGNFRCYQSRQKVFRCFRERKVFRKEDQKVRKVAVDDALFERLRELRMDMAQEAGVPPYVVFSDSTLKEMCEKLPQTTIQLLQIKGVPK